jgi:dienelactone hydrolase
VLSVCSFGGEILDPDILSQPDQRDWGKLDLPAFLARNSKETRSPEIFGCAKELRSRYKKVGVIGFCYGGWGVFQLGAKENNGLVDCISTGHPSGLTKEEMDKVGVPVQILAPEHDPLFTPELKEYANKVIPTLAVPYDYQYFPGMVHGFAIRGGPNVPGERDAMERAKNAAVFWFRQWLGE